MAAEGFAGSSRGRTTKTTSTTGGKLPWPGVELHVHAETEWADGGTELDPNWREVDANGHGHFPVDGALPTLKWLAQPCTQGHGDDCVSDGRWVCRECELIVNPRKREAQPTPVVSTKTYRLVHIKDGVKTTYVFGEVEWRSLVEAVDDMIQEILTPSTVQMESWR